MARKAARRIVMKTECLWQLCVLLYGPLIVLVMQQCGSRMIGTSYLGVLYSVLVYINFSTNVSAKELDADER